MNRPEGGTDMLKWIFVFLMVAIALGVAIAVIELTEEREEDASVVDIYIGYTDAGHLNEIPAWGPNYRPLHTYVLAQDRRTRRGFVVRAGPERKCGEEDVRPFRSPSPSGSSASGSSNSCPIFCKPANELSGRSKLWAHSFWGVNECETETLHKQFVRSIGRPLRDIVGQMTRMAEANNTCNNEEYSSGVRIFATNNCPTPYNSNSFAFSVARELTGMTPEPQFGTALSVGRCEFEPAHGWKQAVSLEAC